MIYYMQHKSPITAEDLEPLFPKGLIAQEMSTESYIDIPQEVSDTTATADIPHDLKMVLHGLNTFQACYVEGGT